MTDIYEVPAPHPGSVRDMTSRDEESPVHVQETPEAFGDMVIPVRDEMPEETIPRTVQLNTGNTFLMILPRDMRRRRATVIPVNNDIWLCESREMASQAAGINAASGFGLAAHIPSGTNLVIESRDQMWAASTTAATTSIAVIVERFAKD